MKYGIIDNQTKKFLVVSDNREFLLQTITKHMPQFCAEDIKEYTDEDIVYDYNGICYLKDEDFEIPQPSKEDIRAWRRQYRIDNCDSLTLEKVRKMSLGRWTAEDEAAYVKKMQEIDDYVARNMPYSVMQEQCSENYMSVVPHVGVDV